MDVRYSYSREIEVVITLKKIKYPPQREGSFRYIKADLSMCNHNLLILRCVLLLKHLDEVDAFG